MAAVLVVTLAWPGVSPLPSAAYTGSGGTNVSSSNHTMIDYDEDYVAEELAVKLNYGNLTGTSGIEKNSSSATGALKKKDVSSSSTMVIYLDHGDYFTKGSKNTAHTYSGSSFWGSLIFEDVADIGGKSVDATVTIKRVAMGKHLSYTGSASSTSFKAYETTDASKVGIAYVNSSGLHVGAIESNETVRSYTWVAQRDIKVSVELTWGENPGDVDPDCSKGDVVSLDFYTYITDIDVNNAHTEEKWFYESGDGFGSTIAKRSAYSGNVLKTSYSSGTRTYWHYRASDAQENAVTGATEMAEYENGSEESCKKTGVYTQTEGGSFTSTFSVSLCQMTLGVYSQYEAVNSPTKRILTAAGNYVTSSTACAGDTVTYVWHWQMGKAWKNTTQAYSSLRLVDDLPDNATFSKAILYYGNRAAVNAGTATKISQVTSSSTTSSSSSAARGKGTFEYLADKDKVRFTFDETWLSGDADADGDTDEFSSVYAGQYYSMYVEVVIPAGTAAETEVCNNESVKVSGSTYEGNSVVTTVKADPAPVLTITKSNTTVTADGTVSISPSATWTSFKGTASNSSWYVGYVQTSAALVAGSYVKFTVRSGLVVYAELSTDVSAGAWLAIASPYALTSTSTTADTLRLYSFSSKPSDGFTTPSSPCGTHVQTSSLMQTTDGDTSARWAEAGSTITWKVVVTATKAKALDVEIEDTMPDGLTLTSVKASGAYAGDLTTSYKKSTGYWKVTATYLPASRSITVTITSTLSDSYDYARCVQTNTAYARASNADEVSASAAVVSYMDGSEPVVPELAITKEADVEEVTTGVLSEFTISGYDGLAYNYELNVCAYTQLPEELEAGSYARWDIDDETTFWFKADITMSAGWYIGATCQGATFSAAKVSSIDLFYSSAPAYGFYDDTYISLTTISETLPTRTAKLVQAGDTVSWTVMVTQTTASASAYSTVISDTLPDGLTLLSEPVTSKGTVSSWDSSSWYVTVGTLSYGTTVTVTFETEVQEGYAQVSLINTASTWASGIDAVYATDTVEPIPSPDEPSKYQKTVGWDESADDLEWSDDNYSEANAVKARYDDTVCYRIEQTMPEYEYSTITFSDVLPAELVRSGTWAIYLDGEDVTSKWSCSYGTYSSSNGTSTKATCSSPSSSWFDGSSTLAFEIECSVYSSAQVGTFCNTATVSFDSHAGTTNEVWTNLWLAAQDPGISITKTAEVEPSPEGVYDESDYVALSGYDGTSSSSGDTTLYLYKALPSCLEEGEWVRWEPDWGDEDSEDEETSDADEDATATLESAANSYWFQAPADMDAGQWVALGWDSDGALTWEVTAFSALPEGGEGTALGTAEVISADVKYVEAGASFWWSVTVEESNQYATAEHVVVTDTIPDELAYVSGSLSTTLGTASFDEDTNAWTVDLGEPGQLGEYVGAYSFEVRFATTAPEAHDDAIVNTASVTADGGLSAEASDEVVVYVPSEQLPTTGSGTMPVLGATAAAAALVGVCVAVHARRRRRQREQLVHNFHRV